MQLVDKNIEAKQLYQTKCDSEAIVLVLKVGAIATSGL